MAEMGITINDRAYQIMCRDGDEPQVSKLAADLGARVADIVKSAQPAGAVGDSQLLVLASLTLLSELRDLNHEMDRLKSEVAQAKSDRDVLNARIADMENTVATAITEAAEKLEAFAQS